MTLSTTITKTLRGFLHIVKKKFDTSWRITNINTGYCNQARTHRGFDWDLEWIFECCCEWFSSCVYCLWSYPTQWNCMLHTSPQKMDQLSQCPCKSHPRREKYDEIVPTLTCQLCNISSNCAIPLPATPCFHQLYEVWISSRSQYFTFQKQQNPTKRGEISPIWHFAQS